MLAASPRLIGSAGRTPPPYVGSSSSLAGASIKDIVATVGARYGLGYGEVIGERRGGRYTAARYAAIYAAVQAKPNLALARIAAHFRVAPKTVRHAIKTMRAVEPPPSVRHAPVPQEIVTDRRLAALADENETLREENRQLREALVPEVRMPTGWRLTRLEDRLARALLAVGLNALTTDRAMLALYGSADDPPSPEIIPCVMSKVRGKLRAAGLDIAITCQRLEGYRLTPEGHAALSAALAAISGAPPAHHCRTLKRESERGSLSPTTLHGSDLAIPGVDHA